MKSAPNDESKNRKYWAQDKRAAEQRLAGLGGQLMDSPHAYEMWRWVHPDLTLIFYPHRTSASNYHCRVRAGQCTNRETLRKAIFALAENSCTFQFPTERKWHSEGVMASIDRERAAIEAKAAKRAPGVRGTPAPAYDVMHDSRTFNPNADAPSRRNDKPAHAMAAEYEALDRTKPCRNVSDCPDLMHCGTGGMCLKLHAPGVQGSCLLPAEKMENNGAPGVAVAHRCPTRGIPCADVHPTNQCPQCPDGVQALPPSEEFARDLETLIRWAEGSVLHGDRATDAARRMRQRIEARTHGVQGASRAWQLQALNLARALAIAQSTLDMEAHCQPGDSWMNKLPAIEAAEKELMAHLQTAPGMEGTSK